MSQIFHPSTNTIARVSIFGLVFFVALAGWVAMTLDRSPAVTRERQVVDQPVPFSHKHHIVDVGLDCRYCHTTVEKSAFAGIPPTATCMGCHSQLFTDAPLLEPVRASFRDNVPLQWNRVYDLPDFVYFNHSIHVAKGIGCTSCHGDIGHMPMTWKAVSLKMEFCTNCHRDPTPYVRPRDQVFNPNWDPASLSNAQRVALMKEYKVQSRMSCSVCHR